MMKWINDDEDDDDDDDVERMNGFLNIFTEPFIVCSLGDVEEKDGILLEEVGWLMISTSRFQQ